jgi:hypothetical protein
MASLRHGMGTPVATPVYLREASPLNDTAPPNKFPHFSSFARRLCLRGRHRSAYLREGGLDPDSTTHTPRLDDSYHPAVVFNRPSRARCPHSEGDNELKGPHMQPGKIYRRRDSAISLTGPRQNFSVGRLDDRNLAVWRVREFFSFSVRFAISLAMRALCAL